MQFKRERVLNSVTLSNRMANAQDRKEESGLLQG